jgi:hypothetical protein
MRTSTIIPKKHPATNAHGAEGVTNVINNAFVGLAQA